MTSLRSEVPRLASIITLVAQYHPRGLRVLLGQDPEPTTEELADLVNDISSREDLGVQVDTSSISQEALNLVCRMEGVDEIIEMARGWPNVSAAARDVQLLEPLAWNLFAEGIMWVSCGSRLNEEGHLARIAHKYGVSVPTVSKWRTDVPLLIARNALLGGQSVLSFVRSMAQCGV